MFVLYQFYGGPIFLSRTTSRDHGSRIRAATPEKTVRKSPAKNENKEDNGGRIDKQKLYEIARKNAAAMLKSGVLQKHLSTMSTEDLMKLRSGGKSMEELIGMCSFSCVFRRFDLLAFRVLSEDSEEGRETGSRRRQ